MRKISFIIPCYRSEKTVGQVISELNTVVGETCEYEVITVNDCSPDNVLGRLKEFAAEDSRIKVIDLARNMGKHSALMAGYAHATGDVIVGLDDDGQCPVDHLWELLEPLEQGYDISLARYPEKKQSKFKNFGSTVNDWMTRIMIEKPKNLKLSNFYAMKRFVCDEMLRYHNPYPYVDGLMLRTTRKIKNVDMQERERLSGTTGYTLVKSLKLWINGFTSFSVKPLRIATFLGLITAVIGFLVAFYVVIHRILHPEIVAGYTSLMAVLLLIGGIIMVLLGMIGEYLGRIYICINNSPQYVIRETINIDCFSEGGKIS